MKFLADENIEKEIVDTLRGLSFEVLYIMEFSRSLPDTEILQMANQKELIIITNDKDFGEIIFQQNLVSHGIILLRIDSEDIEMKIDKIRLLLEKFKEKIKGYFIVLTENKIRFRKM